MTATNAKSADLAAAVEKKHSADLKRQARTGVAICLLLILGVGGWSAMAQIASAVIAPGVVVVDGNSKKIQHPSGGIVGELKVKIGDRVKAGDLLIKLDETQVRSTLGVVNSQLVQNISRLARYEAEREGANAITFPAGFIEGSTEARDAAAGERRLFAARQQSLSGQKEQLAERIKQLQQEAEGLSAQLTSKENEVDLQMKDITRLEGLYDQQLVNETRMNGLKRDMVRLEGDLGSLVSQIARVKAQISQIELQIIQLEQDARTEAQKELRETEAKIAELTERKTAAMDTLKRIEIRAPIDGSVHEMNVHTVGGVIQPGETLMLIVPSGEPLTIEARISPADIDQVALDRRAVMRFTAFNQRTTPEVDGTVTHVAADLSREPQTNTPYFLVRIRPTVAATEKLAGLRIVPGMPVESFIETGERTAISFLVKPLVDNLKRSFRER